jgi:hypothetical protein
MAKHILKVVSCSFAHHGNVVLFQRRRVAAKVKRGRTRVAADKVAALAARVATVVIVALSCNIVKDSD